MDLQKIAVPKQKICSWDIVIGNRFSDPNSNPVSYNTLREGMNPTILSSALD